MYPAAPAIRKKIAARTRTALRRPAASIFRFWESGAMATSRSMNLPTSFPAMTHVVDLTGKHYRSQQTVFRQSGGCTAPRDFDGYRFHHARTAILLIATGADKADAVYAMVHGEISPQCPASILQRIPMR